ncbi:MAG: hypothetical protein JWM41_4820 [Gemmatimonadetes bacterium]|nr:hypothetical protein [Gemmatimonadota bacterium]
MRRILHCFTILICSISAISACSLSTAPSTSTYGSGPRRILFVGNSLTAANDMPSMLVALAESAKVSPLPSVDVYWLPDYALIDHWNAGGARALVAGRHYDLVVLQQGPSSVAVNRDTLRIAASLFAPLIRSGGGMPAMLAVWPTIDRLQDFDRATESYSLAAKEVRGYMLPGGEVWRAAWRRDPSLLFYSDGLHPSPLGSYAVALSILGMLYDRSVVGLPSSFRLRGAGSYAFEPTVARLIQESADEANKRYGFQGRP